LQQALLSFEQQAAFALESHVAQSFFVAQDARSIEDAAIRTVARRIMCMIWSKVVNQPLWRPSAYLPLITGGGGGGGGVCWQELRTAEAAMRVRIAIFMCVWVLTSLLSFPSTRLLAAGFSEINDNFCFCKQPNAFSAKTRKGCPDDDKI
jgi:hypothetical protein